MKLNEKQIHILNVSEKLFAENGFDGTSVRTIAKEADVNVAMISYYFGSKEKLLETFLLYRIADFRNELLKVINQEKSYTERLDDLIKLIIHRTHDKRRMYKIIHFEFSNETRGFDFKAYTKEKLESFKTIKSFVEKGQDAGVFNKNVNIELLMPTVQGSYFNFYYNKRFYKTLIPLENDVAVDIYVHQTLTKHIQQTIKSLLTYEI
ncbi:TetR family transcriptional regulator [Wenyingzhuangia sp. 2_MG-2023]|uniref:TetR family transcriptional regulator n=1 Tax=Wenyingzhuangia sp. 2_MG-2023 TaxID=3062639 RepID=UPI0026E2A5A2|nr:TetR family transcriptional regulator [Wenyingzhuangia sp. 2_MG-2023]MDO6738758.1 TetR family transcriptional regulator [Wenyingzhuangia sp. 2_MG-2023]MDO6801993.1 TetR family transcriptional regulator [Wenyingzhuangia sp. 1_MG-2023]